MTKRTSLMVASLVVAVAISGEAQTAADKAEQIQAASLWSGWWRLNLEKSTYDGMPRPMPPEGQVRQYSLRPDGFWVESVFTTDADGLPSFRQRVFTLDGTNKQSSLGSVRLAEFLVTGKRPAEPTATYRMVGPYTVERLDQEPSGTLRSTTRTVSADGQSFTLTIKGTNPQGQPLHEVEFFERIAK